MRADAGRWALPAFCAAALLLGGSVQAVWSNLILQLGALLLVTWAMLRGRPPEHSRWLVALLWLIVLLPAVQLVPLPPAVWSNLPGREEAVRGFALRNEPLPWLPISLAPYETIATGLMLLPPVVVFTSMMRLTTLRPLDLMMVILSCASLHVLLGLMQVSAGTAWYLHAFSNAGAATGFFANANHLAAMLLVSLPILAAAASEYSARIDASGKRILWLLVAAAGSLLLLGLLLTGSSAGMLLALPVVGASLTLFRGVHLLGRRSVLAAAALLALAGGVALSVASRDSTALLSRQQIWEKTAPLVVKYAPLGSGLGTFEPLYRLTEDPSSVDRTFINRAHNDYLQLALETGVPGMLLLLAFLAWWMRRTYRLWQPGGGDLRARAGTIASGALLAHSLVDYPLRTSANATLLAICIALMSGARFVPAPPPRSLRHLTA
ncbi:O-antigen ligase family protein [Sphingomonas arenae]|uniref:O-antigen ligase family protein n=1 Tax=Sphingomonas arenae TaxID=2812555 RepID=UPI001968542A|nr:O-antigen ligase family protein [Sphingomonas arenae]